jgi:hypothetical protein
MNFPVANADQGTSHDGDAALVIKLAPRFTNRGVT